MNLYATKKTAAEGMLDIALFLANITHMKTVIEQGAGYRYSVCVRGKERSVSYWRVLSGFRLLNYHIYCCLKQYLLINICCITFFSLLLRYYIAVLTLISFSLALQIVAGVLIIIIGEPITLQH